eukprot:scaffold96412_cov36-Phaeocystis_antarctica.AAC.1
MPEVAGALPEGITLVVINCGPSSQDKGSQTKANNGGVEPAKVFKLAMRAFHAEVAILPKTAVVFLVSEPFSNTKGTLSRLIPERRSACCVFSPGGKDAAVVWGSKQLGRTSPELVFSLGPPRSMYGLDPAQCLTRHNALLSRLAVAELQLPLPPEVSPAPGICRKSLFLCYHGPSTGAAKADKVGWARDLFDLAWALATRVGAPIAVGGDFNLNAAGVEEEE